MADRKLEAVLCDLDDCLIPTTKFVNMAINAAMDAIMLEGIDVSRDKLFDTYMEVRKEYGSNSTKHLDITLEKLGIEKKRANELIASALIRYHNLKVAVQPYPDVPGTLHTLKDGGYGLYIVTEGDSLKQWDKIKRAGFDSRLFRGVFITEDYKFQTKCSEFYKKAIEEMNVDPRYCLMVGDRVDKDIAHARECGMNTIRVLTGKYKEEQYPNDADYIIPQFSDILKKISEIEKKL